LESPAGSPPRRAAFRHLLPGCCHTDTGGRRVRAGTGADAATQQLAYDIYKKLVEINAVTETGDTGRAADAMAARLQAAGFDSTDVQLSKPAPRAVARRPRLRWQLRS
jgi:hypothetical protein